jgi:hypothetical protein
VIDETVYHLLTDEDLAISLQSVRTIFNGGIFHKLQYAIFPQRIASAAAAVCAGGASEATLAEAAGHDASV